MATAPLRYFSKQVCVNKPYLVAIVDAQGIHRAAEKTDCYVVVWIADEAFAVMFIVIKLVLCKSEHYLSFLPASSQIHSVGWLVYARFLLSFTKSGQGIITFLVSGVQHLGSGVGCFGTPLFC